MGRTSKNFQLWAKKNKKGLQTGTIGLALVFLAWLVLSHAWFTDDAYFSFRSVDNFVNGFGLTWNVTERVQAYTHPLWVLLLSIFYFFTREIYLTTILISLVLTLGLAVLILRSTENKWRALAAIFLLTLSTAFVDYTTSGLENPLSHLLLGIFLIIFLQKENSSRKLFWMALLAALGAVNRLDTVLIYLPALLYEWWQHKDRVRAAGQIALGFLPLLAWEIFSLVYYGFPFPNTYYAKVQNYVALSEEIWAGLNYFLFTLKFDPLTWFVIVAAFATAAWQRQRQAMVIMLGVLLYLAYILQIGGDFMGGRFLSTAYLGSVFVLLYFLFPKLKFKKHWVLIPTALLLSLIASSPPYFLYAKGFQTARWNGVVDERMVYYATDFLRIEDLHAFNANPSHNLFNEVAFFLRSFGRGSLFRLEAENDWIDLGRSLRAQAASEGRLVLPQGANGFTGFYAGPDVYIINNLALTDGLLARVPPVYNPNWRSGHFKRLTPLGYLEAEAGAQAGLDDPTLDKYFQKIRLVIEGPLFAPGRWAAIWELNTKNFGELLPGYSASFRFPALQTIALEVMPQLGAELIFDLDFGGLGSAAQIDFPQLAHIAGLQLGLSAGDNFRLVYLDSTGSELASQQLMSNLDEGVETYSLAVPQNVAEVGFAAIRIVPIRVLYAEADGQYTLSTIGFK